MEDMSYEAGWHRFGMPFGHAMAVSHSDTFALLSFMLVDKNMLHFVDPEQRRLGILSIALKSAMATLPNFLRKDSL